MLLSESARSELSGTWHTVNQLLRFSIRPFIVLTGPAGSGIKVGGQRNVVAPQLFKGKEFNFSKLGIGGLDIQFEQIFRRAFASRVFPPSVVERLGIHHVKGVLLFGPPGTGKTLIARQIGKMLNGREPKVHSASLHVAFATDLSFACVQDMALIRKQPSISHAGLPFYPHTAVDRHRHCSPQASLINEALCSTSRVDRR